MARIIRIGKTNWLAGMSWRSFEDRPSKADITDDAKQLNAQWYAVRVGESAIQGGFCMPPDGCKTPTKLYSLAAMLADSQKQPWLGIFKIDDGIWWYIAVRDGHAILPDGDLIGDETTILAAREQHSGYADWNYIEGDATELARIIDEIKLNKTPVKSLVQSYSYVSMVVAVASLLIIAAGIWWYIHTRQTAQLAQARIRAEMSKKLPPPVISPMLTTPDPEAWLMACGKTIDQTPLSINGWLLTGIECQTNEVNLTWKRGMSATVADMPGGALLDNNIVTSTSTISAPNGKNDAIAFDDAKRILIAGLQRSGIDVQIIQTPVVPALPGQSAPTTTTQIPSQPQASFKFNTLLPIFELKLNTPGVRFTKIKFTESGWQVEGILYGK